MLREKGQKPRGPSPVQTRLNKKATLVKTVFWPQGSNIGRQETNSLNTHIERVTRPSHGTEEGILRQGRPSWQGGGRGGNGVSNSLPSE